jgi:hypothetical protein
MSTDNAAIGQAQAFRLAGFALAQAAWSVENGGDLVPLGIAKAELRPEETSPWDS